MTPSHAQPFLVTNLSPKLAHLLRRSSHVDDGFLLLLVFFLADPEEFDDQSQFRALLAAVMPPWAPQQAAIVANLHSRNASPRGVTAPLSSKGIAKIIVGDFFPSLLVTFGSSYRPDRLGYRPPVCFAPQGMP
jgi:hypothetical protein